jgi:hypothetical protein
MGFQDPSLHIHPEDWNCVVCQNIGKPSKFDMAYAQKLKLYNGFSCENLRTRI